MWKFACLRRARHSVPREAELCHISGFQLRHQRVGSGEVKSRPKSPGQLWASVSGDLHQHLNPSLEPVRSLWEHLGDAVPQGVVMIFEMQCCFILELEYVMCTINKSGPKGTYVYGRLKLNRKGTWEAVRVVEASPRSWLSGVESPLQLSPAVCQSWIWSRDEFL